MSMFEVPQKLTCSRCGAPRIITKISKPQRDRVVLYMTCPNHKSQIVYRMTLPLFEQAAGLIREHVALCRKCGQPTEIIGPRISGRMAQLEIRCPVHGLGDRPINTSLLDMLMGAPPPAPPPGVPHHAPPPGPPPEGSRFCPSCGTPVASPEAQFCHKCGSSLQ
ncbi:MAG: zinc ribbon domain-containing protein [Promethearchaeota archaeon]